MRFCLQNRFLTAFRGRERGDQRRIFGVDVFPERRMPPTAAIDYVREENADVVKAGRIQYKYDLPGAC